MSVNKTISDVNSSESKGFKIAFLNAFNKVISAVKDFFYDMSCKIHGFFAKRVKPKELTLKQLKNKKYWDETLFIALFLAVPIIQYAICYIGININSVLLAFHEYVGGEKIFVGFKNFSYVLDDLINDLTLKHAVTNSLLAYVWTTFFALPLNLVFAYVIFKKIPAYGFFQVILFLPSILSTIVISLMFSYFVDEALPEIFKLLFKVERFESLFFRPETAFGIQVFYSIWSSFGMQLILYSGAMSGIESSVIEYGELEGITMFQEFWHVCIPLIFNTITVFLVTGVAGIFTNQLALFNFFGEGARSDINTLGYYFYVKVIAQTATDSDYVYASTAGFLFSVIATPITLLAKYLLEKFGPSEV